MKSDNLNCGGDKREGADNPPTTVIKYTILSLTTISL